MSSSLAATTSKLAGALLAFAANSVLCRLALRHSGIDAMTFTLVRLASGALLLSLLLLWPPRAAPDVDGEPAARPRAGQQLLGSAWLLLYALPFALAYVRLEAGVGALLLFGAVQLTIMVSAIVGGERPAPREWVGLLGAFGGLVYLVAPGLRAPDPLGALFMAASGVGWGLYTLAGKRQGGTPLSRNARSFSLAALALALPAALTWPSLSLDRRGLALAVASGAGASGLGYVLWYAALPQISATRAALVQLFVPVIAAAGGVALLGERVTRRLLVGAAITLGALAYALAAKRTKANIRRHEEKPR